MLCNHSTCKLDLSKIRSCCVISLPKRHFSLGHYLPLMKCWKLFLSQVTVVNFRFDFLISFFVWRYKPLMFFWEFELNSEWQQNTLSEFFWSIKSKSRVNGQQPDDDDNVRCDDPLQINSTKKNMMRAEVQNLPKKRQILFI